MKDKSALEAAVNAFARQKWTDTDPQVCMRAAISAYLVAGSFDSVHAPVETELPAVKVKPMPHEPTQEMLSAAMRADQDGGSASMKTIWMVMWGAYAAANTTALTLKDDPGNGGDGEAERLREALEAALVALDTYADPTGYTDGYGELLPADAEQHEGLLAKEAADNIRSILTTKA